MISVMAAENAVVFVADVAGIKSAVFGRDLGQRDQLIGFAVRAWVVDEPGRQAPGAVAHAAIDEGLHFGQFVGRRVAVDVAHDVVADTVVRDLVNDVSADAVFSIVLK